MEEQSTENLDHAIGHLKDIEKMTSSKDDFKN
jgi:hypothetical protein